MTRPYSAESAQDHKLLGDPNHSELGRYLDTVGDGSGTKTMNAVANTYRLSPPAGYIYVIDEIRIVGWDNAIASGGTFVGTTALTNGCLLEIREKPGSSAEVVIQDLTDGLPLKNNGDLASIGTFTMISDNTATTSMIQCRIQPGAPYRVEGARGESLVFQVRDSLAAVLGFKVMAVGRAYTNAL